MNQIEPYVIKNNNKTVKFATKLVQLYSKILILIYKKNCNLTIKN